MKVIELSNRTIFTDDIIQIYRDDDGYAPTRFYVVTEHGAYKISLEDYKKVKEYLLSLNDEVEIIEDTPKEIYFSKEEYDNLMEDIRKNNVEKKDNFYDYYKEDKNIEKMDIRVDGTGTEYVVGKRFGKAFGKGFVDYAEKINEIIDVVNQLEKQPPIININGPQSPIMQEPYKITCNMESNGENNGT